MPGHIALLWVITIGSMLALVWASPSVKRHRGPSWFDLLPFMTVSKKQRTRAQQTPTHRRRKNRR